jgi:hypothetical protein
MDLLDPEKRPIPILGSRFWESKRGINGKAAGKLDTLLRLYHSSGCLSELAPYWREANSGEEQVRS